MPYLASHPSVFHRNFFFSFFFFFAEFRALSDGAPPRLPLVSRGARRLMSRFGRRALKYRSENACASVPLEHVIVTRSDRFFLSLEGLHGGPAHEHAMDEEGNGLLPYFQTQFRWRWRRDAKRRSKRNGRIAGADYLQRNDGITTKLFAV